MLNMECGIEVTHIFIFKLGFIVYNHGEGNSIVTIDAIQDKIRHLDASGKCERDSFDSLGEIFSCCNDKLLSI